MLGKIGGSIIALMGLGWRFTPFSRHAQPGHCREAGDSTIGATPTETSAKVFREALVIPKG